MNYDARSNLPFCRYNPWDDLEYILSLSEDMPLPEKCFLPRDGIPQRDPNRYFDYRFDLMMEAENALRSILGLLVEFKQRRKLLQFLLFFCDQLEIRYDKRTGEFLNGQFRIDFSDRISLRYCTQLCGCIILQDGKQNLFHDISPIAVDELRCLLAELWETLRELPGWELIEEQDETVTLRRKGKPRLPVCTD